MRQRRWFVLSMFRDYFSEFFPIFFHVFQSISGVYAFYSAKDIPGTNSFVPWRLMHPDLGVVEDEEIFVGLDSMIQYHGQPCGLILANSMALANYAATQVKITYKKVKQKPEFVTGNMLSIIDSLQETAATPNQGMAAESGGKTRINYFKIIYLPFFHIFQEN